MTGTFVAEMLADAPWAWLRPVGRLGGSITNRGSGSAFTYGPAVACPPLLSTEGGNALAGTSTTNALCAYAASLSSMPAGLSGDNVTIGFLVRIPASPSTAGCFVKIGGNANGWGIGLGNTTWVTDGSKLILLSETVAWQPTAYSMTAGVHWVEIVRGASGAFTCYVDAVSVATGTLSSPITATGQISIGGGSASSSPPTGFSYCGLNKDIQIDKVCIWAGANSSGRVTAHYNGGAIDDAAILADNPVVFLDFDAAPTIYTDYSGNNRHFGGAYSGAASKVPGPYGYPAGIGFASGADYIRTAATMTQPTTATYAAWVYLPTAPTTDTAILVASYASGVIGPTSGLMISSAGKAKLSLYNGSDLSITAPSALAAGWNHVVVSVGAAGAKIRVNKTTVATSATTAVQNFGAGCHLWMHNLYNGSITTTNGSAVHIADAEFWPSQLADARTDAHYDAFLASNQQLLAA